MIRRMNDSDVDSYYPASGLNGRDSKNKTASPFMWKGKIVRDGSRTPF